LHEVNQHPTVTDQQSLAIGQKPFVADRLLTVFDRRATTLEH
jgi:hypothetical protein